MKHSSIHRSLVALVSVWPLLISSWVPTSPLTTAMPESLAYVEAGLRSTDDAMSVIVTAAAPDMARRAVIKVDGVVAHDLWLINAVAADLTSKQIAALAHQPGIVSVMTNYGIASAQATEPWDGYVSDRRTQHKQKAVASGLAYAPVTTPDGGLLLLHNDGRLVQLDANGYLILDQQVANASSPPVAAEDGSIYLRSTDRLDAYNRNGSLRWSYPLASSNSPTGDVAISDTRVYVMGGQRQLLALDRVTGILVGTGPLDNRQGAKVAFGPLMDTNGMVYVVTDGEGKKSQIRLYAFTPDASLRWVAEMGEDERVQQLTLDSNGSIYLITQATNVYAFADDGSRRYQTFLGQQPVGKVSAAADGALYLGLPDRLLVLSADGSQRFVHYETNGIVAGPIRTRDYRRLYAVTGDKSLLALDTQTGSILWRVTIPAQVADDPVVLRDGTIHLVDMDRRHLQITPDGSMSILETMDETIADLLVGANDSLFEAQAGGNVITHAKLPKRWSGRPDVINGANFKKWDLVNPVSIDVGADVLHEMSLPNGKSIQGLGVTVAVLDSGVYFDKDVKKELGPQISHLFWGQADFFDRSCTITTSGNQVVTLGQQYDDHCFTDASNSKDAYGHGTHVAGSIWNKLQDEASGVFLGVAPDAKILSVRVLGSDGRGTYADAIAGIQYVVANKERFNVRVLNVSMSAPVSTPYFADPLNRAVEQAWANGIVVVAAAGNNGPHAETITVPGNDPYVITVGALDSQRTPGYWPGDTVTSWSSAGPTMDGFVKPDVLAPGAQIISYMYNDHGGGSDTSWLVQKHPDYSLNTSLFRMNGTSMATALTSGVVALMLQVHPLLTPDQVKYRLMQSAKPALAGDDVLAYSFVQQGAGRIWAPDAVLGDFPEEERANQGMDLQVDLMYGWDSEEELEHHYRGPIERYLSDDGQFYLYLLDDEQDVWTVGVARVDTLEWVNWEDLSAAQTTWNGGTFAPTGGDTESSSRFTWAGSRFTWAGSRFTWAGSRFTWAGSRFTWAGSRFTWAGSRFTWAGGLSDWESLDSSASLNATHWVNDDGTVEPCLSLPDEPPVTEPEPAPPSSSPVSAASLHIVDLDGSSVWQSNSHWMASVEIAVVDNYGNIVNDARVDLDWQHAKGIGQSSCHTTSDGRCTVNIGGIHKKSYEIGIAVRNVLYANFVYDTSADTDPDGDSSGSQISIGIPASQRFADVSDHHEDLGVLFLPVVER